MTYPHTPQGTGKRRGMIEERRTRFYFYENTWKNFQVSRHLFFLVPWRPYMRRFEGPTHTCDIPMCSPAVPQEIQRCGSAEGAFFWPIMSQG